MCKYVITYDIGTTGIKTCLIEIDDEMKILGSATAGYGLYVDEEAGGVKGGARRRRMVGGNVHHYKDCF